MRKISSYQSFPVRNNNTMKELILKLGTLTVKSASVRAELRYTPVTIGETVRGTLDLCLVHVIFIYFSDC